MCANVINTKIMPIKLYPLSIFLTFFYCLAHAQDTVKVSTLAGTDNNAEKFYNSGIAKFSSKDYNGAMTDFNQAIAMNASFDKAFYNRGIVRFEMKDVKGAMEDYTQAITINDSCAQCYFSRGQAKARRLHRVYCRL